MNCMKNKLLYLTFVSVIIILAVFLSACGDGNKVDPSENTTNPNKSTTISTTEPITSESVSNFENGAESNEVYEYYQCVFADEGQYSAEKNMTPSYLYFHENIFSEEYKLLLAKKLKNGNLAEFKNCVYVITEEDEIIEVSKIDGTYKIVYEAKYGTIDYISSVNCVNRYVYFNDGNYIIELDPITNECVEKIKCDRNIVAIHPGGDVMVINDLSIYCDICGPDGEYFIYTVGSEEEGYESYWHHPETGEDELIDINYVHTYGGDFKEEYNHLGWKVDK